MRSHVIKLEESELISPPKSARQIAAGANRTLWMTLTKGEAKGVVASVARVQTRTARAKFKIVRVQR